MVFCETLKLHMESNIETVERSIKSQKKKNRHFQIRERAQDISVHCLTNPTHYYLIVIIVDQPAFLVMWFLTEIVILKFGLREQKPFKM